MNKSLVSLNVLVMLAAFSLTNCGFKQDPLAGLPPGLRNPQKPGEGAKKPKEGFEPDNFVVDAPTGVSVAEESVAKFTISARVLVPDYDDVTLSIGNLAEFPGAKFDTSTGEFSWKPTRGTTKGEASIALSLRAIAFAKNKILNKTIKTEANVFIVVTINPMDPELFYVGPLPLRMRENDYTKAFIVKVREPGVVNGSGSSPTLIFSDSKKYDYSLAPRVTVTGVSFDATNKVWQYNCELDLTGEITKSGVDAGMVVRAVTKFGRSSVEMQMATTIFTQLPNALSTWNENKTFDIGKESHIEFAVYNPNGEGEVLFDRTSDIPQGATLTCAPDGPVLNCEFVYTPTVSDYGWLEFSVNTYNTDKRDTTPKRSYFSFDLEVN